MQKVMQPDVCLPEGVELMHRALRRREAILCGCRGRATHARFRGPDFTGVRAGI
jgi:hypothetical protein